MNQKILRAYNLLQDIQGKCLSSADDHMVLAVTGSCARGDDTDGSDLEYVRHYLLTKYRGATVNWAFPDNVSDKAKQTFDRFQQQAEDYARK